MSNSIIIPFWDLEPVLEKHYQLSGGRLPPTFSFFWVSVLGAFDFVDEVVKDDGGVGSVLEFGGKGMGEGSGFNDFADGLDGLDGVGEVFVTRHEESSIVTVLVGVEEHVGNEHDVDAFLKGSAVVLSEGECFDFDVQVV